MKKKLTVVLTIIGLAIFYIPSFAQKTGVKGGVNFSNLYQDKIDDKNMKIGINAGIYIQGKLGERISIQPEFLYSRQGTEVKYDDFQGTGQAGKYRYTLGYLQIPMLMVVHMGKFNFHTGPYVGWLLHAHVKSIDDKGFIQQIEDLDRDDFNTFDVGVSAGLGHDFKEGILGIRYSLGLRRIGEAGEFGDISIQKSKNSVLQFYIGFNL